MDTKQVTVKLGSDTKQTKPTNTKKNNKTQPSVDLNKEFQRAKDENITRLNLSKNNITVVPPNIKDLANLVELYLYGNKIAVLPPEIGCLTQLQTLALNGEFGRVNIFHRDFNLFSLASPNRKSGESRQSKLKPKQSYLIILFYSSIHYQSRSRTSRNWKFWTCVTTNWVIESNSVSCDAILQTLVRDLQAKIFPTQFTNWKTWRRSTCALIESEMSAKRSGTWRNWQCSAYARTRSKVCRGALDPS